MDIISREDLKGKIDRRDRFKLVMVLNDFAFRAKRIPGSVNISNMEDAAKQLSPSDEIVVDCSSETCAASRYAYGMLADAGFQNVRPLRRRHRRLGGRRLPA